MTCFRLLRRIPRRSIRNVTFTGWTLPWCTHCVVKNGKAVATGASASSAGPKASSSASAGAAGAATTSGTGTGTGTGTTTSATGPVTGVVVNLAGDHSNQAALGALTAFGIVLAVALPPGLAAWLRRRRGQARG